MRLDKSILAVAVALDVVIAGYCDGLFQGGILRRDIRKINILDLFDFLLDKFYFAMHTSIVKQNMG